jgi:hypothetical protein
MKRALIATAAASILAATAFIVPADARSGGGAGSFRGGGGGASFRGGAAPSFLSGGVSAFRSGGGSAFRSANVGTQFRGGNVGTQFRSGRSAQFRGAPFRANARFAHNFRGRRFIAGGPFFYDYGYPGY